MRFRKKLDLRGAKDKTQQIQDHVNDLQAQLEREITRMEERLRTLEKEVAGSGN